MVEKSLESCMQVKVEVQTSIFREETCIGYKIGMNSLKH